MRRLALVAFCLGLFFAGAPSANASDRSRFNRLVVFGDSLSDNGNSLFLFEVPQTPYYNGRYSNGPNWVDYFPFVAHHHFSTATAYFPNPDNGTNFAVGDSISADLLESEPTGFPAQIPSYLATPAEKPPLRTSMLFGSVRTISAQESAQSRLYRTFATGLLGSGRRAQEPSL